MLDERTADPREIIAELRRERDEALEQQAAIAEVLQVINSSRGDLQPVFDAILEKALRLCEAGFGHFRTYDGERFPLEAVRGDPRFINVMHQRAPLAPGPHHPAAMFIAGEDVNHMADAADSDAYRSDRRFRELVDTGVCRSLLGVALRKDKTLLGYIAVYRQEVRPFTDKQIALVQNFATQAVIAMENAQLITETREALEQQTATAEVLQVINASPGDLAPVFDAMLDKAVRLCDAAFGILWVFDGEFTRAGALHEVPEAYAELIRTPFRPSPESGPARVMRGAGTIAIADVMALPGYAGGDFLVRSIVDLAGARSIVIVPMRKDGVTLGAITTYRTEVRPFGDKQIALLENFAAQAVIAMENARLITETREALEQQTATAEILQVINSSPGDLQPVFNTMVEKAVRLCGAAHGTLRIFDGEALHLAAMAGEPEVAARVHQTGPIRLQAGNPFEPLAHGERIIHVGDARELPGYRKFAATRERIDAAGVRTWLAVALRKEDALVGALAVFRPEVRPFSEREIALLENFAAQAVIAMENARLITETREALEQQTATAEVLQVINASPGDLAPVFDTMLEKAMRLCEAAFGMFSLGGEQFQIVAQRGVPEKLAQYLRTPYQAVPGTAIRQFSDGEQFLNIADLTADPASLLTRPRRRAYAELGGARSILSVPLRKDQILLGGLTVFRQEVRPFTEKQIALLQNFAAQAVIAIENARLLTETRKALEQQTATAEVLQVINASPGDLAPVFDAMLDKAVRLCDAAFGSLVRFDGEYLHIAALHKVPPKLAEFLQTPRRVEPGTPIDRMSRGERFVHVPDATAVPEYISSNPTSIAYFELGGARSVLVVPLRKEGTILGAIVAYRQEVRPFTDKQIALLESFAAQAVIAMENARLLNEIRQRQAELRVTFENMGDGVAMFDGEMRLAAWNMNFQQILELPDDFLAQRPTFAEYFRYMAARGEYQSDELTAEIGRYVEDPGHEARFERTRPDGRVIEVRRNTVPGGGFVLIYSDVTEQRHSETEIRAARDASEKALSDLKSAQASLLHAQKMSALGQLTAGIAHEIKNPLNFVNNFATLSNELLAELKEIAAPAFDTLDADARADIDETIDMLSGNLEKIAEHGKRADNIVKSMLAHSRGSSGERQEVNLNALIDEALNLAYHGARAHDQNFNITMERDFDASLAPVELVPQDMMRVFINLIGNGFHAAHQRRLQAADPGFRPVLTVATRDIGDAVEVRVRDNGTGILPEHRDRLFQPFFTTKPTGEGTGLGLSISYDIVTQEHGGTITVESEPGMFSEFTVRLPRSRQAEAAGAATGRAA
jgi:GAF domain-containing protein